MIRAWWALSVMCAALIACGDDSSSSSGGWQLRPGVSAVYTGNALEALGIVDVDVDGDRIAVLRIDETANYASIDLSEDAGQTWRTINIIRAVVNDLGGDTFHQGVHLENGHIYFLISRSDLFISWWAFFEVDPTTGDTREIMFPFSFPATGWHEHLPNGHFRYVTGGETPIVYDIDLATGTYTHQDFAVTGSAAQVFEYRSADNGATWDGYTTAQPSPYDMCRVHIDVGANTATQSCVHRPAWPAPDYNYLPNMMFRDGAPYMLWSQNDQIYATSIRGTQPPSVSETLLFGPGKLSSPHAGLLPRPRWADLELAENWGGDGTLLRLDGAGAHWAAIPLTPCVTDTGCGYPINGYGYGLVQWVERTPQGDYLVFYAVETSSSSDRFHQVIYMERIATPPLADVADAVPPPVVPLEVPPGAQPMGPLERACYLYATCTIITDNALLTAMYNGCVKSFSTTSASAPGMAAARARLIAGSADCTTLRQAYPEAYNVAGCPLGCEMSGGTCTGSTCSTEVTYNASQCGQCDGSGNYLLCSGGHMFAVACGGGTACSAGWGCALTGGSTACSAYDPTPSCTSATDARTCNYSSNLLTTQDCGVAGATCSAGVCVSPTTEGACYTPGYMMACNAANTAAIGCAFGLLQYVKCSDLGFTECIYGKCQ